jgi:hypothetical protein
MRVNAPDFEHQERLRTDKLPPIADFTERDRSFRVIVTGVGMPNGSWQMIAQSVNLRQY